MIVDSETNTYVLVHHKGKITMSFSHHEYPDYTVKEYCRQLKESFWAYHGD